MAELADALALGASLLLEVRVRVPLSAQTLNLFLWQKQEKNKKIFGLSPWADWKKSAVI